VTLSDPEERGFRRADGLLGIGLIQRLNLSTDVRASRLWAKRNARPPRPERYGMSGLWLEQRRDDVEIAVISPQSPAADAGLRVGDRLVGGTLQEWIGRLGGRPGQAIQIPYRRGAETGTATLTLREYL
jgi:serine protease Do